MGERYWITGVQLGMLIAANNAGKENVIDDVLKTIQDQQFIGNTKPRPEVETPYSLLQEWKDDQADEPDHDSEEGTLADSNTEVEKSTPTEMKPDDD